MRTKEQHDAAYNGITPAEFGARTSQSAGNVRALIASGWFTGKLVDGRPALSDIAGPNAGQPRYKINPGAVSLYLTERAEPRDSRSRKAS